MKDFTGFKVLTTLPSLELLNGKTVKKTIKKAFSDYSGSVYVVRLNGISGDWELYENEMYK